MKTERAILAGGCFWGMQDLIRSYDVDASGLWPGKVVTEVAPAGDFWEAEPEHQDYLERYPDGYTCHFVRSNWKLPLTSSHA
jgi:peptide-methionine (S)-S-oxide reductase